MPPYLHPRSKQTSTLFTTTLAVSFLVVALPHILPCPVDQRRFADSATTIDGKRRAKNNKEQVDDASSEAGDGMRAIESISGSRARECPVPKPGGRLGNFFGFKQTEKPTPVEVVIVPRSQASVKKTETP